MDNAVAPIQAVAQCRHCGTIATALTLEREGEMKNAVIWCEKGHVTVNSPTLTCQGKLVFDFRDERV